MKLRLMKKTTSCGDTVFYFQVLQKTWFSERWYDCYPDTSSPFVQFGYFSYVTKDAAEQDLERTKNAKKFLTQPHEVVGEYEL